MTDHPLHEHQPVWYRGRPAIIVQMFPAAILIRFQDHANGVMRISRKSIETREP